MIRLSLSIGVVLLTVAAVHAQRPDDRPDRHDGLVTTLAAVTEHR